MQQLILGREGASESLQRTAIRNSDALPHLALILLTNLTIYDLVFDAFLISIRCYIHFDSRSNFAARTPKAFSQCLAIIRESCPFYHQQVRKLIAQHSDLVMCRKQPGIAIGRLCDKCDGKCPVCDSYVRPTTLVRICDECSFGNYQNKCVVCGGEVSFLFPLFGWANRS